MPSQKYSIRDISSLENYRGVRNYPEISYSTSEILAEILKSHKSEILKIDPSVRISLYTSTFAFIACAHHTPQKGVASKTTPELLTCN